MAKIHSYSEPDALAKVVGELVQLSLSDDAHPSGLCAALTIAAIRIGLQFAPNVEVAFVFVIKAPACRTSWTLDAARRARVRWCVPLHIVVLQARDRECDLRSSRELAGFDVGLAGKSKTARARFAICMLGDNRKRRWFSTSERSKHSNLMVDG
jgi:hypothetical protein